MVELLPLTLALAFIHPITHQTERLDLNWRERFPSQEYTGQIVGWQEDRINWLIRQRSNETRRSQWDRWTHLIWEQRCRQYTWILLTSPSDIGEELRHRIGEEAWAAGQMPDPFDLGDGQ